MNPFLAEHNIRPVIEQVYSFSDAIEAFRHLSRGAFGKIVIKIGD
nr:zinc-binding dehydrogenase [Rahnella aquatilis]